MYIRAFYLFQACPIKFESELIFSWEVFYKLKSYMKRMLIIILMLHLSGMNRPIPKSQLLT
jgi:hypothetical protein